jgi:divalent metal cation (Fe/Co/Zn/Cd) transporter
VDKVDAQFEGSQEGLRALWLSLLILGVTAAVQALVVLWSGSVALLGDTLHNLADALTAVPLALAFVVGRRPPSRRYTYGYGRAEDVAGIVIVAFIAASAVAAGWAAIDRLLHPADVSYLGAVAGAAVFGFLGNEVVAQLRIRVGRKIGSAAGRIRSSAWPSRSPSWSCFGMPPARSTDGSWTPSIPPQWMPWRRSFEPRRVFGTSARFICGGSATGSGRSARSSSTLN